MNQKTISALLARGIDSHTAKSLIEIGYTLVKLKIENKEVLQGIGLTTAQISNIRSGSRPPIPSDILTSVLYKSAQTCCVCRNKKNPIIIHHIEDWSKSHSHNEDNLVVLCLICHDKAHSKSSISANLDSSRLFQFKKNWEKTVKETEIKTLFTKSSWNLLSGFWDYLNHNRIIDISNAFGINLKKIEGYLVAVAK